MFKTIQRLPRLTLMILVYGIFLVVVGVTAVVLTVVISAHVSTASLNATVGADAALVRLFVTSTLSPDDLGAAGPTPSRQADLERRLALLIDPNKILRVEVRLPDGRVIAADDPASRGSTAVPSEDFATVMSGRSATATIIGIEASEATGPVLPTTNVLREYFPLVTEGQVRAVVGVWRDAVPILEQLETVRQTIVVITLAAGSFAAFVLYLVFRSAQGRISRQTDALLEATRRDTLTGTLNHGALVERLALAVEEARTAETQIGVALIDIDNFRLLNDNYGHDAGDQALLVIVGLLASELPRGVAFGRSGPDELLVVAPGVAVIEVEDALVRARAALADRALDVDSAERLPLTFSAGLCSYPASAASAAGLLTVAANTLQEAKTSGGDVIRVAGAISGQPAETRTFDVFQGLILAVDTKDRYTKRHSEDVARYSVFLAERLALPPDLVDTIRIAGLLHDVGKIGIPDQILRKPGVLTADEYEIVKQHVALGDMIIRDLPGIETIRSGIRHHHERWDGEGYLHRLSGEDIPLIARILAVSDAFSAMTTTRPYRKALPVSEALERLVDASGSQLDEALVESFVTGIETAPDAPLPGADVHSMRLWTPYHQVA